MMNFCTLFDSYYLLKGLGLYMSLERVTNDFHLYVMAFDRECYDKLLSLELEHMTVELLDDFETPELLAVKPTRSKGEYCWTCGPSVIYHFLRKYELDDITYLDSDLFFLADPKIAFDEVGNMSVAITEQGISEKSAKTYGKYCVQYLTFRNDEDGIGALTWWRDRCIEWCFQKLEDNRYGDQKYLDEFPKKWKNVYVVKNLGVGIAPWNMHRYQYDGRELSYKGETYPQVFFHMHGMKPEIIESTLHLSSLHQELNKELIDRFFLPYANLLKDVLNQYLGYHISDTEVHDMPFLKKIEYRIRGLVRNSKLVRWIYFVALGKKDKGHGIKIN